jgi:hypothetical protein
VGAYINNPLWRQILIEEAITAPVHPKNIGNNWTKSVLSIGVVALILTMVGVPVYGFIISAESGAIPLNQSTVGVSVNVPGVNNAPYGDIIWYIISHWGAHPSVPSVVHWIIEGFLDVGLEASAYFVGGLAGIEDAAGAILATGIFEDSLVATIMLGFVSNPIGWAVIIGIASFVVGE